MTIAPSPFNLEGSGTSYLLGIGSQSGIDGWFRRLATSMRMGDTNRGVNGASIANSAAAGVGGIGDLLQAVSRPVAQLPIFTNQPFLPVSGIYALCYGQGDASLLGNAGYPRVAATLESAILKILSTAMMEEDNATYTNYTGSISYTQQASTTKNSGAGFKFSGSGPFTRAVGARLTGLAAAGWNGQDIFVGHMVDGIGGAASGAKYEYRLNGLNVPGGNGIIIPGPDTRGLAALGNNPMVCTPCYFRIPGSVIGDLNTIIEVLITTASSSGIADEFDGWGILANGPGPLILGLIPNRLIAANFSVGGGTPINDVDVLNIADVFRNVYAKYPNNIIPVELEPVLNKNPQLFAADFIHPNDRGHALIAQACIDACNASPLYSEYLATNEINVPTNAKYGLAAMAGGFANVADDTVTATTIILATGQTPTIGPVRVSARTPGVGFQLADASGVANGTVGYVMYDIN